MPNLWSECSSCQSFWPLSDSVCHIYQTLALHINQSISISSVVISKSSLVLVNEILETWVPSSFNGSLFSSMVVFASSNFFFFLTLALSVCSCTDFLMSSAFLFGCPRLSVGTQSVVFILGFCQTTGDKMATTNMVVFQDLFSQVISAYSHDPLH